MRPESNARSVYLLCPLEARPLDPVLGRDGNFRQLPVGERRRRHVQILGLGPDLQRLETLGDAMEGDNRPLLGNDVVDMLTASLRLD